MIKLSGEKVALLFSTGPMAEDIKFIKWWMKKKKTGLLETMSKESIATLRYT